MDTESLGSVQTPGWDTYDSSPSFKLDQEFCQSRKPSETDPAFLDLGSLGKIQVLDKVDMMGDESKEMRGSLQQQRDMGLDQLLGRLKGDVRKLLVLIKSFTVSNVNSSTMYSVEPKLKEIRDLHVDIWSRADEVCSEYEKELGPSKVQEVEDKMNQQHAKVNQHETDVRAKVLQLAPHPTPLTADGLGA